jgi:beta-galactosidase
MVSEPTARGLVEYVKNGGTLVTEARAAWNDERGRATPIIPGSGLHEVCGCRETDVQQAATGKTELIVGDADPSLPLLAAGDRLKGFVYEETLEPIGKNARVVASFADGRPGIIASTFGKGRMLTFGTFFGAAYEGDRDASVANLFRGTLDWAGISRPVEVTNGPDVEVRMLQSGATDLVVVLNHGAAATEPSIRLKTSSLRDLVTGQNVPLQRDGDRYVLKVPLAPSDVRVFVSGGKR